MATATKNPHAAPPPPERRPAGVASVVSAVYRAVDAVYRFLASLKLAVISLGSLAAVLAYATFFESKYGTTAVQEWVYRTPGFAILLAFLGANILCAALIRFPWKKRQTGFVITHAGLLVLLAGSWWSVMTADEGQVAAMEGEVKDELIRNDYPVIRVRQVNPHAPDEALHEWELPFRPGTFGWGPGQPRPRSAVAGLLHPFSAEERNPREELTLPKDPFRFVVKSHIPASVPAVQHVADPAGAPMAKIRPTFKAPNMPGPREVFGDEDQWFVSDRKFYRVVKGGEGGSAMMPAQFAFSYVDRPELVDDFLNPPAELGDEGLARLRYRDKAGKARAYDWALDGQRGKAVTLPDSDLSVTLVNVVEFPAAEFGLSRTLGDPVVPLAQFEVKAGDGPSVRYLAIASLPMVPNLLPSANPDHAGPPPKPLISVNYMVAPVLDPKTNGRFGLVEVLGTPEGALYYRVFGRGETGQTRGRVRAKGAVAKGKEITAFGGNANMPMTIAFTVDDYLTAGVEKEVCEPFALPRGQTGNGLAASLVEMTVTDPETGKESTKEFFIRRSATFDPDWKTVAFPSGVYRVAYDVDRRPLGFELKLIDFQRGFDPGTEQASRYSSDVKLTDKAMGIVDRPHHISMNNPLTHRGYTFYQSSFTPNKETGHFQSVFQVGYDPGRRIKYAGCLLVVLGAFVQFYMRAGVFTDGGKRERERAAAKTLKTGGASANGHAADTPLPAPEPRAADVEDIL